MTHKEILEQTKSELDRLVSEAKRKLDNLYRPKLESGKWYKDTDERSNLLVYITDIKDDEIVGYGFGVSGKWLAPNRKFYSWNIHNAYSFLVEATRQEVEDALALEAKRRGIIEGVSVIDLDDGKDFLLKKGGAYLLSFSSNKLFAHGATVFKDGIWATIIEKPVDKFAELKKAHKNGAVIEYRHASLPNASWKINNNPAWNDNYEYRIKPEEKTTLDQDIKALKEKYPNLRFTITIEDNI